MPATHELPPLPSPSPKQSPQTMGDLFRLGWEGYKEHFKHLSLLWITVLAPLAALIQVFCYRALGDWESLRTHVSSSMLSVVSLIGLGLMIHSLAWKEGAGAYPRLLKSIRFTAERFTGIFLIGVVAVFGVLLGLTMLIIPGVILLCGLVLFPPIAFQEDMGFDSIAASWERTRGHRLTIFYFTLAWNLGLVLFGILVVVLSLIPAIRFFGISAGNPTFRYWLDLSISVVTIHLVFVVHIALWRASRAWKSGASWAPAPALSAPVLMPLPEPDLAPMARSQDQAAEAPQRPRRSSPAKPRVSKAVKKAVLKRKTKTSKPSSKKKRT